MNKCRCMIIAMLLVVQCEWLGGCGKKGPAGRGITTIPLIIYIDPKFLKNSERVYLNTKIVEYTGTPTLGEDGQIVFTGRPVKGVYYDDIAWIFWRAGVRRGDGLVDALGHAILPNVFFVTKPTGGKLPNTFDVIYAVDQARPICSWGWYQGRNNVCIYPDAIWRDTRSDQSQAEITLASDEQLRELVAWAIAHEIGHNPNFMGTAFHHTTDNRNDIITCSMAGGEPGHVTCAVMSLIDNCIRGQLPIEWCDECAEKLRDALGGQGYSPHDD